MQIILFIIGLLLLIGGAELLVRGASRLAASIGISPLVIGLTVVAFGTSSPELAVSIKSALTDKAGLSLGNVVGSNIFNVLFILGLSAIITPLTVSQQLIRFDVPLMIILSFLVLFFTLDGNINHWNGIILFIGLMIYIGFLIYTSKKENSKVKEEYAKEFSEKEKSSFGWLKNGFYVILGLIFLIFGSEWLVESAIIFAQYIGISEVVIGLTIVAAGTSLPEVVTSVIASIRGERDIAVGNVVGSNIFNIMGVLGMSSIVAPSGIDVSSSFIGFDIPIMIGVAFICLPIFFTGGRITRPEGFLFLGYYIIYTIYLIMNTSHHDALPIFNAIVLYFILPITFLTLIIISVHEIYKSKNKSNV
ncbi:MAG: calcium/sodium antiporter [Spirochaetia bacterium]|nr:calcium/sodium antiporter [Spirochaetia bacterium]